MEGVRVVYGEVFLVRERNFPGQVLCRTFLPHWNLHCNDDAGFESALGSTGQDQPRRPGLNRRINNDLGVLAAGLNIALDIELLDGERLNFC